MNGTATNRQEYLYLVQRYVANWAIGPSTLRGQGKGVSAAARRFLGELDLGELRDVSQRNYTRWLDGKTSKAMREFPQAAKKNWGAARKAINLLMVGAYWNRVLCCAYRLDRFGDALETPLDGIAANRLRREARTAGIRLPTWPGILNLTAAESEQYQAYASQYAAQVGLPIAELDITLWPGRGK